MNSPLLLYLKVHRRAHKSTYLDLILIQLNSFSILTPYFPKIHFDILLSTTRYAMWLLAFSLPNQNFV
jgi:hypothetical protein